MPRIVSRLGKLTPAPLRDIPILIGGQGGRKTLRLVAEYPTMWHGFTTAEAYPGKAKVLDQHCADLGRDPSAIERSAGGEDNNGRARGEGEAGLAGQSAGLRWVR